MSAESMSTGRIVALSGLAENVWKSRYRLPASLRERMWGLRAIAWEASQ